MIFLDKAFIVTKCLYTPESTVTDKFPTVHKWVDNHRREMVRYTPGPAILDRRAAIAPSVSSWHRWSCCAAAITVQTIQTILVIHYGLVTYVLVL